MKDVKISNDIIYIGADDKDIDLFENQYKVPNGISYNSYVIMDEKIAIMETIDRRKTDEWLENLENALNGREPDYLIISHLEPDHAYNIGTVIKKYPNIKLVGNNKTFAFLPQFFDIEDLEERKVEVKEGDILELGKHKLHFIIAPMVHWPEVMMTYESTTGTLFSADAFGAFGAMSGNIFADEVRWDHDWRDEARRYYVNIVGKYGPQTQAVLKKASTLDIKMICPLHAHIWRKDFEQILSRYHQWSTYEPQRYSVAIFYGSIYGNTQNAAEILAMKLAEEGMRSVMVFDTSKTDTSELVSRAFQYSTLVFASATYNAEVFDSMQNLLTELKNHNLSNRTIGLVENGSWAPMAANKMKAQLASMKNMKIVDPIVKIQSSVSEENLKQLEVLAKELAANTK